MGPVQALDISGKLALNGHMFASQLSNNNYYYSGPSSLILSNASGVTNLITVANATGNMELLTGALTVSGAGNNSFAGSVGIGTNSLGATLDVKAVSGNTYAVKVSSNNGTGLMVVQQNGNVGIGTTTPSALLEVRNGAIKVIGPNSSQTTTLTVDGANSAQTISEFYASEANPRMAIGIDLINGYGFGQAGIAFSAASSGAGLVNAIGTDGNSNLGFFTGGTANANEKMTIMSGGNVGIGVVSPGQALEVNGGIRMNTLSAQPVCSGTTRGTFWIVQGGAGVKDSVQVCAKDAAEAYAWRTVY